MKLALKVPLTLVVPAPANVKAVAALDGWAVETPLPIFNVFPELTLMVILLTPKVLDCKEAIVAVVVSVKVELLVLIRAISVVPLCPG